MKRPGSIIAALVVCVIAGSVYFATRTPEGLTPMNGGGSETIAWISLAVAVLTFAAAVVGLIQKLVELRAAKGG